MSLEGFHRWQCNEVLEATWTQGFASGWDSMIATFEVSVYIYPFHKWYLNESFNDVRKTRRHFLSWKTTSILLNCGLYQWKNTLRNQQKNVNNSPLHQEINRHFWGFYKWYWSESFNDVRRSRRHCLSRRTAWFHLNSGVYQWKRTFRNPQKIVNNSLLDQ